ncbi:MAG: tRNA (adenosine(37)-N6)-threonylcarbamoyltransferase complex dimerization subunit type 1 TsaB [Gemmatimonadetes bacterium]|nr:tRNA (adenosine(37)-N6)-threonylcarbamoyltransferase complex dimerization subunit type 1 TsaB [Gemmatimonadota bacterium]MYB71273.1 tRNA (adenosine(37)-N6)-threonylcarbamoyltransferase complex dimerization subunit type 1 TsaB [Gemmatimonadota bacterium]
MGAPWPQATAKRRRAIGVAVSVRGCGVILALDTATPVGSVALCAAAGIIVNRYFDVGLQHSQRLFSEMEAALEATDMDVGEVRAVAVAIGPGSFTGLRIGLSAAKGLCLAADKDLVPVPTLEALAARLPFAHVPICTVLDAHKREVYAALYDTATGVPVELVPPRAIAPAQLAQERVNEPTIYTGDGATAYRELLAGNPAAQFAPLSCARPDAGTIGWLALSKLEKGQTADLASVEPDYLRSPDARPLARA